MLTKIAVEVPGLVIVTDGAAEGLGRVLMRRSWRNTSRALLLSLFSKFVVVTDRPELFSASEGNATQRPSALITG